MNRAGFRLCPSRLSVRDESGSAVVEFVMVGALVVIVFVALLQVALGVYARNVLTPPATGPVGPLWSEAPRLRLDSGCRSCPTPRCVAAT